MSLTWRLMENARYALGCVMPRGPKGKKRPRDTNQLAKLMVDILTGQVEDRQPTPEEHGKNPAAVALGRLGAAKGGKSRAARLSAEERTVSARIAAKARWQKRP
jgi:hypothetical protein